MPDAQNRREKDGCPLAGHLPSETPLCLPARRDAGQIRHPQSDGCPWTGIHPRRLNAGHAAPTDDLHPGSKNHRAIDPHRLAFRPSGDRRRLTSRNRRSG